MQDKIDSVITKAPEFDTVSLRVDDGTKKVSVIDVIRMVIKVSSTRAAQLLLRLRHDLRERCDQLIINGKGRPTWVADACTVVDIIWELPGKEANVVRCQSAMDICRILGSDLTVMKKIETRFIRTSPSARELMTAYVERPVVQITNNAEHTMLELEKERLSIKERYAAIECRATERKENEMNIRRMGIENDNLEIASFGATAKILKEIGRFDARDEIMFGDMIKVQQQRQLKRRTVSESNTGVLLIESHDDVKRKRREISIPLVAQELNIRTNGKDGQIGKLIVKRWREKHGKTVSEQPVKRDTLFRGKPYVENTYFDDDYDIVEESIWAVCDGK
jgi:hypothetical protein